MDLSSAPGELTSHTTEHQMGNGRAYRMGKRAGLTGKYHLSHRNGRRYDSVSANESYQQGYSQGIRERLSASRSDLFEVCGVHAPRRTKWTGL